MKLIDKLQKKLASIVTTEFSADIKAEDIIFERPADERHGDWSTNLAMNIAGRLKQNPREVAEKLVAELQTTADYDGDVIQSVSVAGPGFINFKLKFEYYLDHLVDSQIEEDLRLPRKGKRIMVEYGHPNTHKLPHIGHLYSYIVGDSLSRILEAKGHEIYRVNYQGDVGPHVAKCLYGWIKNGRQEPQSLGDKVDLLQQCYQQGAKAYEEDEQAKQEIKQINKQVYQRNSTIEDDWRKTRQWSLDFYLQLEEKLAVKQKEHYLESQLWEKGMEIVRENIGTVFTESDGAIVYKGEQDGLHTRVFITKQNTATYECKEVGLNWQKMQDWQYDLTIIPTASEQNGYFDVVIKAIEKAVPELDNKIEHIGFGMVSLTSGKMSSRKGNILSAPELVTTVEEEVGKIVNSREGFTAEEKLRITEKVAMAAVKYAFLRSNIMQNMTFDIKESVSFEGNSGPYLQYTYARIKSVLNTPVDTSLPKNNTKSVLSALNSPSEIALIKWIERYEETVTGAADSRSPHLIANYLFELAQRFNSFYKQNSINSAETNQLIAARRQLSESVANLLAHGLGLLGIEVVEKM